MSYFKNFKPITSKKNIEIQTKDIRLEYINSDGQDEELLLITYVTKKYLELFENIKLNYNKKYSNIENIIFQFSKDITFSTQIHRIIFNKYFGSDSDYSEEMRKKR